eukprot:scaffold16659_cov70-Phaeocystis_antarctica.AAC.6
MVRDADVGCSAAHGAGGPRQHAGGRPWARPREGRLSTGRNAELEPRRRPGDSTLNSTRLDSCLAI